MTHAPTKPVHPAEPEQTPHGPGSAGQPAHGRWTPHSWRTKPNQSGFCYDDQAGLERAADQLAKLPPLVTSWEVERLRGLLAEAGRGERFVLQGGDCAESFEDCTPQGIATKLKILLQMSLVLVHGLKKPVVRVGRFAGQYAKPRSNATQTREVAGKSITLPSYFGDMINRSAFDEASRRPDPALMLAAHQHAGLTLNFIRALATGGFADAHHVEQWDMSFLAQAGLPAALRAEYERMREGLSDGLRFMEALGERAITDISRAEFFTSHEGLNLWYEAALTRTVPRRTGHYDLSTHLPWIGDRTRDISGAHAEFFRGVRNPVGVKLGPTATPADVVALAGLLNPENVPGKFVCVARMGVANIERVLPPLLEATKRAGVTCVWLCDPMHGNTRVTKAGVKTRDFADILGEVMVAHAIHARAGVPLAGVHVEVTGDDVTECVGGAGGLREADLSARYESACDPRLNYHQAMELAFAIARRG